MFRVFFVQPILRLAYFICSAYPFLQPQNRPALCYCLRDRKQSLGIYERQNEYEKREPQYFNRRLGLIVYHYPIYYLVVQKKYRIGKPAYSAAEPRERRCPHNYVSERMQNAKHRKAEQMKRYILDERQLDKKQYGGTYIRQSYEMPVF